MINESFDSAQITTRNQIDDMISKFTNTLMEAQSASVPRVLPKKYALILTPNITEMMKLRGILERRYQRSRVPSRKTHLKWLINNLQNDINDAVSNLRNSNWSDYLENMPTDDNSKRLWQTSKFLRNKCKKMPPLKLENNTYVTPQEKATALADKFVVAHANPLANTNTAHNRQIETEAENITHQQHNLEDISIPSVKEIASYVKHLKNSKAPGEDRVHNSLLKNLPKSGILYLHFIVVCCFRLCYFPKQWKKAQVICIPKPGKNFFRPFKLSTNFFA